MKLLSKARLAYFAAGTAVLAASYALMDGEPPRVTTRAEVPLPAAPHVVAAPSKEARTGAASASPRATASTPDFAALERELAGSDPGARDLVLQKFLPALFAQDPEAAARFAEREADPALRELTIRQVALLWGASDAERALNWARSLTDEHERDATLIDIANGLSSVDPAGGVHLREQFAGNAKTDSALSNLVQQWAGFDFDAALAWTNARPSGAQRDDLLQRLLYVRAATGDSEAAARLVSESSLTGDAKAAAVASIAEEWVLKNPAATREWLQSLDRDSSHAAMANLGAAAGSAP